jgi:hypothetical protein
MMHNVRLIDVNDNPLSPGLRAKRSRIPGWICLASFILCFRRNPLALISARAAAIFASNHMADF